jgi:two-component system, chemotaxis family, chemotaxis protein CheY
MSTRVLCVDDSATIRKLVAKALEPAGVEVLQAENGRDALAKPVAGCDVLIVDVNMPEMDGFAFVEAIRAQPEVAEKPVVFLTTESSEGKKDRGKALSVSGWVVKPFKPEDLRQLVAALTA